MCIAMTIVTSNEIPSSTIKRFANEDIYINRVYEGNILNLFNNNRDKVYMITNGMCSCDFFKRTGNKQVLNKNILLLKELIRCLYNNGNFVKIYIHEYEGKYQEEHLPKPFKKKISLEELLCVIDSIQEDILYIIY